MIHDDHILIKRAQKGDQEAFSKIFDIFYPKLLKFILRKTEGKQALSEDIISETFVKALKHLHQFQPHDDIPVIAWFYRIADNELKIFWRKNNRYRFEALEEHPELRSDHGNMLDHIISIDDRALIEKALKFLSEKDRKIIHKHYFEYIPLTEIAQTQNEKHSAVKARIHRARKKLKKIIIELQPNTDENIMMNR